MKLRRDEFGNLIIRKSLLNPKPQSGVDFIEGDDDDDSIDLDNEMSENEKAAKKEKKRLAK